MALDSDELERRANKLHVMVSVENVQAAFICELAVQVAKLRETIEPLITWILETRTK